MSRLSSTGQLLLIAATLAVAAYVLIACAQNPDHPAVTATALATDVLLSFAAFVVALVLYVAARAVTPLLLARWRHWRAVRRRVRRRARRIGVRR